MSRTISAREQHEARPDRAVRISALRFNTWLVDEMERQDVSIRSLSRASGIDHSTISRIAAADRDPLLATANRIAGALGYQLQIVAR